MLSKCRYSAGYSAADSQVSSLCPERKAHLERNVFLDGGFGGWPRAYIQGIVFLRLVRAMHFSPFVAKNNRLQTK